ncbi:hypothetical protein NUW58_g2369 [Xylaria curta]|uniref:Uncharacterized protein n=1 Tax=Xylaria curta TaxID=42375 RepID=A0ACC1PH92_9PEZI|nr:hypothetical protein NUW58_g2369 [Xylaria curta]
MTTILTFVFFGLYCHVLAAQLDKATSIVAGQPVYYGTAVDHPPALPTIVYNCDRLRAICWNLAEFMNDQTNPGYGAFPLIFHVDTHRNRKNTRRSFSCPDDWQSRHLGNTCGNVPNQPPVQPGNLPPIVVDKVEPGEPEPWNPRGPLFNNEIPNLFQTASSGMFFSCEEMPAASWIEGGDGGPPYVHVNCAPMDLSCQSIQWASVSDVYPNTRSEQNWQGQSHNAISSYARVRSGGAATVMRFALSVANLGAGSPTAAYVKLPGLNGSPDNTAVVNARAKVPEPKARRSYTECEGAFCHELNGKHGFDFDDIKVPPPPTPAAVVGRADQVESDGPEETGEFATVYIIA